MYSRGGRPRNRRGRPLSVRVVSPRDHLPIDDLVPWEMPSPVEDKHFPETQHKEILGTLEHLLGSSEYSDMVLKCGEREYKVHKAIVCTRASVFAQACGGMFKESITNTIELSSDENDVVRMDDPELVRYLIDYFYRLDYLPPKKGSFRISQDQILLMRQEHGNHKPAQPKIYNSLYYLRYSLTDGPPNLTPLVPKLPEEDPRTHAKMYAMGEYYGAPGLKAIAMEKFEKCAEWYWNSPQFAEAADVAYSSTVDSDKGLRNIVAGIFDKYIKLIERPEFQKVLSERNGLALELLKARVADGVS